MVAHLTVGLVFPTRGSLLKTDLAAASRDMISDRAWSVISQALPKGTQRASVRDFLEAVAFRARTGCPWRDLPARFGRWHKIYVRFSKWSAKGWFENLHALALAHAGVDISQASVDSTASKLHKAAHGAKKKANPSGARKAAGPRKSTRSSTPLEKLSGSSSARGARTT